MQILRRQWFILGLAAALGLGFWLAPVGRAINTGGVAADVVVVVIFLATGFNLPTDAIRRGLSNVRLHVYVQLFIFAVVPGYVVLSNLLLGRPFGPIITPGLFALAVLPTTISTCTVFTSLSGGNTVATMFNAALANMLGVVVSPLLLSLLLRGSGAAIPAGQLAGILGSLALRMLLPTVAGQVLRRVLTARGAGGPASDHAGRVERSARGDRRGNGQHQQGGAAHRNERPTPGGDSARSAPDAPRTPALVRKAQSVLILVIVFFAVSRAVGNDVFMGNLPRMGLPFLYLGLSHWLLAAAALLGARLLRFSRADRITALFAAPQKTLAMGAPLLTIYFADRPELLAVSILPLIFHHIFQFATAGIVRGLFFSRDNDNRDDDDGPPPRAPRSTATPPRKEPT